VGLPAHDPRVHRQFRGRLCARGSVREPSEVPPQGLEECLGEPWWHPAASRPARVKAPSKRP